MQTHLLHSVIFEQVLGLYFIIMAVILAARVDYYRDSIEQLVANKNSILISASFTLILGLFIVVTHTLWVLNFNLVLTLIGWLLVIQAVLWLAIPECMGTMVRRMSQVHYYYLVAGISAILGIILIAHTFNLYR